MAACASQSVRGLWRRVPHSLYVRQFIFSVHVFFAAAIHLSVVSANASLFMKVLAERLGHDVPVFSPSWFVAPLAQTAISTFQNTIIYRDGAGRGRDMGRLCIGWRGADATALLLLLEDAGRRGGCAAAVGAAFIAAEEQSQKGRPHRLETDGRVWCYRRRRMRVGASRSALLRSQVGATADRCCWYLRLESIWLQTDDCHLLEWSWTEVPGL